MLTYGVTENELLWLVTFSFFFWLRCMACGILVPQTGIKPAPPALEAQSLDHWTPGEVPPLLLNEANAWL